MSEKFFTTAVDEKGSAQEKNRQWWERLPMTYEDWESDNRETNRTRVIDKFLKANPFLTPQYFASFTGKRVLEVGCGAGAATSLFADAGAEITAIDITSAAVEMTRSHEPRATVLQMDAEAMTFPDNSFDAVFSWGVIHHSANPEKAFANVARVLKPGGTALIMVYYRASLRYWIKGAIWLFVRGRILKGDNFSTVQRCFTDGYFHRHYRIHELSSSLAPLRMTKYHVTHMSKRMLPVIPSTLDEWCKRRWGWLLVGDFLKA